MIPPPGSIPHTVLRGGHSWGALPVGDGAPEGSLISSSRSTMSSLAVYYRAHIICTSTSTRRNLVQVPSASHSQNRAGWNASQWPARPTRRLARHQRSSVSPLTQVKILCLESCPIAVIWSNRHFPPGFRFPAHRDRGSWGHCNNPMAERALWRGSAQELEQKLDRCDNLVASAVQSVRGQATE